MPLRSELDCLAIDSHKGGLTSMMLGYAKDAEEAREAIETVFETEWLRIYGGPDGHEVTRVGTSSRKPDGPKV